LKHYKFKLKNNRVPLTRILSKFVVDLDYKDIPREVSTITKYLILDTLGVTLAGSQELSSNIIMNTVKEFGGKKESTILGYREKTSVVNAALINATMARALEFEETHNIGGHPLVSILPAALSIGEKNGISGTDLITSIVIGYDIHCRIGRGAKTSHILAGLDFTSVCGVFGATAAVGKILGLNEYQLSNAFGLAYSHCSGNLLSERDGTFSKRLQSGLAAKGGILSAILAKNGFTGPSDALEAMGGFFDVYIKNYDLSYVTARLGDEFEIMNSHLKPYPTCRFTHPSIDATLNLVQKYKIIPKNVKKIYVKLPEYMYLQVCYPLETKRAPNNLVLAQFSIPFVIALALCKNEVSLNTFTELNLSNPEIIEISEKVIPQIDKNFKEKSGSILPTEIKIETKEGNNFTEKVVYPKGSPKNFLSEEEIKKKFRDCTLRILDQERIEKVAEIITNLEEVDNIAKLICYIQGKEVKDKGRISK